MNKKQESHESRYKREETTYENLPETRLVIVKDGFVRQHTHSPCDVDKLTGHKKNNLEQGTLLALFCVLYVDDRAFTFQYQDQLTRGLNLIYKHFARFGLEMHI